MRSLLIKALQLPLALIVMFYEWGWSALSVIFDWLARRPFWAWLESQIRRLPPYPAMLLFVLPSIAMFPVKLAALWLLSHGHAMWGTIVIVAAKLVGTAIVARIFTLTKPALMKLAWFARFYHWFKPWKDGWMNTLRASAPWRFARRLREAARVQVRAMVKAVRSWFRPSRRQ